MVGMITASLMALAAGAAAVSPVSVKGSNFVKANGQRFDIVGVAYQPGGSAGFNPGSGLDPLSNAKTCLRDAAIMQKLGINTIRVYNLDPDVSHDECAGIFNAAGIHMVIDVNSPLPGQSINAAEPWTTYTKAYLERVFQVIEAFKGYPNLIGFFSGNEIINDLNSGKIDPPYIRAVTRDMKNYIAKQSPNRIIPVGYSAADVREILVDTSNYLQCNLDDDAKDMSKIDFFGLNSYSWCGESSMAKAGYDELVKDFGSSTVPVFFSEYGCNAVNPRPFTEIGSIYGPDMRPVFSGGISYEWTQEANNYGLVKMSSDQSAQLMPDFANLQKQLAKVDMKALAASNATATSAKPQKCSPGMIKNAGFNNNFTLPAVPAGVQDMIDNGVKTGFKGGKAVKPPTDTKCPVTVKGADGQQISDLAIKIVSSNVTSVAGAFNATVGLNQTTYGASFTQKTENNGTFNAVVNGTAASVTTTTLSTAAVATATPPAPPAQSGNAGAGSYGAAGAGTPASTSASAASAIASSGASAVTIISPIGIMAAVAGMLVL